MSKYILFTGDYWKDTAERVLSTAAQSVVAVIGVDQVLPNAFSLDYKVLAGVAAGGALAALLKSWAKLGATAQVPDGPVVAAKSGGDVELRRADGAVVVIAPADPTTPVTDETVGLVVNADEGPMFH